MKNLVSFVLAIIVVASFIGCETSSPMSNSGPEKGPLLVPEQHSDTLFVSILPYAKGGLLITFEGISPQIVIHPSSSLNTWPTELGNEIRNAVSQAGNGTLYGEITFNVPNTEGTASFEFQGREMPRLGTDGKWHRQDQKITLEVSQGGKYKIVDPTIEDEESILPDYEG
jgi:hypothetical protein